MSNIIGFVDKATNRRVLGWAFDTDKKSPVTVEVFKDNIFLDTKTAVIYRDDLYKLGYSDGCLGFDISLTDKNICENDLLTIYAVSEDGIRQEISSTIPTIEKNINFSGNIDHSDNQCLQGWILDLDNQSDPLILEVFVDDTKVDSIVSDSYREDLDKEGIAFGRCSFDIDMTRFLNDGSEHVVSLFAKNKAGISELFFRKVISASVQMTFDDMLFGNLETPKKDFIRGWVFVKNKSSLKPNLDIFVDDEHISTVKADMKRDDVKAKFNNDGLCGFRVNIPSAFKDGNEHRIKVVVQGNTKFKFDEKRIKLAPEKVQVKTSDSKLSKSPKYKGNIDNNGNRPLIVGWASDGTKEGTIISIYADGQKVGTHTAKLYREDLKKHNINAGYAGFEYPVPLSLMDGKEHLIEIRDEEGKYLISQKNIAYSINRSYTDFDGYLKWSYFYREVAAPFREEDKRCFAYMDWLEKFDSARFSERFKKSGSQPLVSIVMPTYNRDYVIGNAIKSVIEQVYQNWELIIVDDGSQDNTRNVVEGFSDPRIKYFLMPQNGGVSKARNQALKMSKGKYIAYLDTDNDWSGNFLLNTIGNLEENPTFLSGYTAQYLFKGQNRPYAIRFGLFNRTLLENRNFIDMNAFVHKRSLYEKHGGFNENLRRLVDWDLVLRYTTDNKPLAIKNILSNYYYNDGEETITVSESYHDARRELSKKRSQEYGCYDLVHSQIDFNSDGGSEISVLTHGVPHKEVGQQRLHATVIIVSYNIPKILDKCVKSVIDTTDAEYTDIILVDNNSDESTLDKLKEFESIKNVTVIYNKDNKGFTAAVNQGIEISKPYSNIVLLNNDAIATSGWLVELEKVTKRNPDAGIVSPQQVLLANTKTINTHVPYADQYTEIDVTVSYHHKNLVIDEFDNVNPEFRVSFIPFFCVYITRDVINSVGLLDDELGRHYRSDRLYCYSTLYNAQKKIYFTPMSKLYHLHQQSTSHLKKKDDKEYEVMFVKNTWEDRQNDIKWDF
ncbi:glycosyltransferase family 2 protein [Psychromonas sp.]|uniref:glycosyltransferase family 2 protein n=1 Tax=Psychromonas sp. TaxID=1884585 RepID=UPI003A98036E